MFVVYNKILKLSVPQKKYLSFGVKEMGYNFEGKNFSFYFWRRGNTIQYSAINLEYQSVCPSSQLGPPTPSPVSECVSPLDPKVGGRNTLLRVRGWGTQFGRLNRKPFTLIYSVISGVQEYIFTCAVVFHSVIFYQ
jgi:hypothetical protein